MLDWIADLRNRSAFSKWVDKIHFLLDCSFSPLSLHHKLLLKLLFHAWWCSIIQQSLTPELFDMLLCKHGLHLASMPFLKLFGHAFVHSLIANDNLVIWYNLNLAKALPIVLNWDFSNICHRRYLLTILSTSMSIIIGQTRRIPISMAHLWEQDTTCFLMVTCLIDIWVWKLVVDLLCNYHRARSHVWWRWNRTVVYRPISTFKLVSVWNLKCLTRWLLDLYVDDIAFVFTVLFPILSKLDDTPLFGWHPCHFNRTWLKPAVLQTRLITCFIPAK